MIFRKKINASFTQREKRLYEVMQKYRMNLFLKWYFEGIERERSFNPTHFYTEVGFIRNGVNWKIAQKGDLNKKCKRSILKCPFVKIFMGHFFWSNQITFQKGIFCILKTYLGWPKKSVYGKLEVDSKLVKVFSDWRVVASYTSPIWMQDLVRYLGWWNVEQIV